MMWAQSSSVECPPLLSGCAFRQYLTGQKKKEKKNKPMLTSLMFYMTTVYYYAIHQELKLFLKQQGHGNMFKEP